MALIYADDFQQLANNYPTTQAFANMGNLISAQSAAETFQAYGFDYPSYRTDVYMCSAVYDTLRGALCIQSGGTWVGGVVGLRRAFKYTGDTVRFSLRMTLSTTYGGYVGTLLTFGGMYTIGINAQGNYTVNGVDTDAVAYYGSDVTLFHEIVFTPTTMEFWLGERLVTTQSRTSVPVKNLLINLNQTAAFMCVWLHHLIVADNVGTIFNSRIGRKSVKTFPAEALVANNATLFPTSSNALSIIKGLADSANIESGRKIVGSLSTTLAFSGASFTATKTSITPLAACINIQAKKRSPTGDGTTAVPYITVGGIKTRGAVQDISSLWKVYSIEIPMTPSQSFTTFTFGYDHDYAVSPNVYIDNRDGVAIYGPDPVVGGGYALTGTPYTAKSTMNLTKVTADQAQIGAYTTDYQKSNLAVAMTSVDNATYYQDQ